MGVAECVGEVVEPVLERLEDGGRGVTQQPDVVPGVLGSLAPLVHHGRVGVAAGFGQRPATGSVGPLDAGPHSRPPLGAELGAGDVPAAFPEQVHGALSPELPVVGLRGRFGEGSKAGAYAPDPAFGQQVRRSCDHSVEGGDSGLRIAEPRQLAPHVAERLVRRTEGRTQCRPDEADQPAQLLGSLPAVVDRSLQIVTARLLQSRYCPLDLLVRDPLDGFRDRLIDIERVRHTEPLPAATPRNREEWTEPTAEGRPPRVRHLGRCRICDDAARCRRYGGEREPGRRDPGRRESVRSIRPALHVAPGVQGRAEVAGPGPSGRLERRLTLLTWGAAAVAARYRAAGGGPDGTETGQPPVQGRSLSGLRTAQMCLIRSPARSNANTVTVTPSC